MDLKKLINDETEKYIEQNLPETIQKHLEKMMESVIWDIFSNWWDNAKEIKKQISEKININLSKLELMDYNWIIADSIQSHFNTLVQERSVKPVLEILSTVIGKPYEKETITLDDLFEEIKDIYYENAEYYDEVNVSFYAEYDSKHNWIEFWVDIEENTEKEDCRVRFIVGKNWAIFSFSLLNYRWDKKTPIDLTWLNAVEKFIHRLYISWTKIICEDDLEDWEIEFDTNFRKED